MRSASAEAPARPRGAFGLAEQWPLRDFIELGALAGAVPSARLHARNVLWEWRLSALSESAEIVVTELMTNAVAASQFAEWVLPVRLWLLADPTRLVVMVWDTNPQPPMRLDGGEQAESGRGLVLVKAVSGRWGSYATPDL